MREVVALRPGILTTVQDLGRPNYRSYGVAMCGAIDPLALVVANRMVGNSDDAAALEITLGNCAFRFESATHFALAGADTDARLDSEPVAPWSAASAKAGQVLELSVPRSGMRTILALNGGIDVPNALGSRSTDLAAGFGGHQGRQLKSGDRLALGEPHNDVAQERFRVKPPQWEFDSHVIGALRGPEYDSFSAEARRALWNDEWIVSPESNRMGYLLKGPVLDRVSGQGGMELSHGVLPGVIQVPPSGEPIVLLNDAQTTGGYPKIAVVIAADLRKFADMALGGRLRFREYTAAEAAEAKRNVERYLMEVTAAIQSQAKSA